LHTLRTQLDIFQKMIPELSKSFTVYAMDYPGHGWSDIPEADYTADFFVSSVEKFMDKLDIKETIIAGVSIGGSIPLVIAGKNNNRIKGVVSINPYDYPGKGAARGNIVANFFMSIIYLPILGDTFMRMRIRMVEKRIFQGGVYDSASLPTSFLEECFVVGERPGHLSAFINLVRHSGSFCNAHTLYRNITVPILLIYGENDWADQNDRDKTISGIPDVKVETINNARHFLSLEHPDFLNDKIKNFALTL
jgi:pimeloyl-ACP methyl ester carboxylesterase